MSDAYKAGGEQREALEMTLLESLATHGHGRSSYKKIKARTIHTSMCSPSLIGVYIVWMYTVYMCMHACYSCMLTNACTHQDNWVHIWFSIVIIKSWKLPLSTQVFTPSSPLLLHQADFVKRFRLVKECLESRESEVHGKWMTEEAMKKSGKYSQTAIKNITSYCRKFPESLMRPVEYFWLDTYIVQHDTQKHPRTSTANHWR